MSDSTTNAGADNTGSAAATDADALPAASSLLTDGDTGGQQAGAEDAAGTAAAADGEATKVDGKAADGDAAAKGAPEAYEDFTLPEGATLAAEVLDEAKGLAKELDLSQDQAQRVVGLLAKASAESGKTADSAATQRQVDAVKTVVDGWIDEIRKDKDIGGDKLTESLAQAREAMEATTTPQLRELLKRSGLGNNVHVIKHFLQIAPAFRSDKHLDSGAQPGGGAKSKAAVLYDSTPTQ